jgi:hypothetical protein
MDDTDLRLDTFRRFSAATDARFVYRAVRHALIS